MALDPVTAFLDIGKAIIERVLPDPAARDAAKLELLKMDLAAEAQKVMGQLEVNKVEAASPRLLVSGWRPGCGWVCVFGLAIQFVVRPFATWGAALLGHPIDFPSLDMGTLMVLLTGMLGLGYYRTEEKKAGVAAI